MEVDSDCEGFLTHIQFKKYRGDSVPMFTCWWKSGGHSVEPVHNLPQDWWSGKGPLFVTDVIRQGPTARRTAILGTRTRSLVNTSHHLSTVPQNMHATMPSGIGSGPCFDEILKRVEAKVDSNVDVLPEVKCRASGGFCGHLAFLNVVDLRSDKKRKFKRNAAVRTGWQKLSTEVNKVGWKLDTITTMTMQELLDCTDGLFMVEDNGHVVSVDCSKGLIFDCDEPRALRLSRQSLSRCKICTIETIRAIRKRMPN